MRVLIVMGEPFFPQSSGGTQTSTLEIANQMIATGHSVIIASKSKKRSVLGLKVFLAEMLSPRRYYRAAFMGFDNYRAADLLGRLPSILEDAEPDAVLLQAPNGMEIARYLSDQNIPFAVYWRDVETHRMGGSPAGLQAEFIANSMFTSKFYEKNFGIRSTVIPPIVRRERCVSDDSRSRRDYVTFFGNSREKGVDIVVAIAERLPSLKFEFVESWILDRAQRQLLERRIAALPNAIFTSLQRDVRPIFARSRLVLMPSQWEEAWGRVASEAHLNGIPVIGSDIGGLRESIGPGGVLLAPSTPPDVWAYEVGRLCADEAQYSRLSAAASRYALRREMSPPEMIGDIVAILTNAIGRRTAAATP